MLQFTKYIKKNHGSKHIRYWCYNRYRRNHRARVRTWYDFFKLIPCANNCYWIFSLKSGKELPTSTTVYRLIFLYFFKNVQLFIFTQSWLDTHFLYYIMNMYNLHDCIDIEFLTKKCLCRNKWCKKTQHNLLIV